MKKKERKSAYEILILVDGILLERPRSNWNEIAEEIGSNWATVRVCMRTLDVLNTKGYRIHKIAMLEDFENRTEEETNALFKKYGLNLAKEVR